ncbi:MAG: DUF1887 family protein [Clostridia bacterium]|nr:DUF1887 family protein [Clostridia bacterium]
MKRMIELYDERPIENVLATEMFRPEETVLVCPPEKASDDVWKRSLIRYFEHRGCPTRLRFVETSLLDTVRIKKTIQRLIREEPDCAIDISGGTDAALFASGAAAGSRTPVFTYSRKRNTFYDIQNAPFARSRPCTVRLDIRSCFLMAGGELLPGREDNAALSDRLNDLDAIFSAYSSFRSIWPKQVQYFQRVSRADDADLSAEGPRTVKVDHGSATVSEDLLRFLAERGLITDLSLSHDSMSLRFADAMVRFWLRDVGAALELYVYRTCLEAGCFDDVVLSAVVNWRGGDRPGDTVTNEIDVMAVRGVQPFFISCKTCEIKTEALNELAILRDRFGGEGSRAMIVTSSIASRSRSPMRRRAAELGIEVVDWNDIAGGKLPSLLKRS